MPTPNIYIQRFHNFVVAVLSSDLFELRLRVDMNVACLTVERPVLEAGGGAGGHRQLVLHPCPGEGLD